MVRGGEREWYREKVREKNKIKERGMEKERALERERERKLKRQKVIENYIFSHEGENTCVLNTSESAESKIS